MQRRNTISQAVFPTYVGVYRTHPDQDILSPEFSPRMWGCTALDVARHNPFAVFPTYVGVYRQQSNLIRVGLWFSPRMWGCTGYTARSKATNASFPHVCGGVPSRPKPRPKPRPVFPTYVGVYLTGSKVRNATLSFPHVCGGVPINGIKVYPLFKFSPRMWGCTAFRNLTFVRKRCFPHVCGGVPDRNALCNY